MKSNRNWKLSAVSPTPTFAEHKYLQSRFGNLRQLADTNAKVFEQKQQKWNVNWHYAECARAVNLVLPQKYLCLPSFAFLLRTAVAIYSCIISQWFILDKKNIYNMALLCKCRQWWYVMCAALVHARGPKWTYLLFSCFLGLNWLVELVLIVHYCFKMRGDGRNAFMASVVFRKLHTLTPIWQLKAKKKNETGWKSKDTYTYSIFFFGSQTKFLNCLRYFNFFFERFLCEFGTNKKANEWPCHFRQ